MSATRPDAPIPLEARLDLHKVNHDRRASTYEAERKRRPKHETILVLTCLLAVSYTYPVESFDENPVIEIAAISLKIPLRDAIAVFPTIIATLYLVYLSAALSHFNALSAFMQSREILDYFEKTGEILRFQEIRRERRLGINWVRYLFLPSPLHPRASAFSEVGYVSRAIVDFFVGLIFNLLPYAAVGFIAYRSWVLLDSFWILGWDFVCMAAMFLSLLSAFLSAVER